MFLLNHRLLFPNVENADDEKVEKEGGSNDESGVRDLNEVVASLKKGDEIEGSVFQGTVKDASGIEVNVTCSAFDEDKSDREEGGEDDAHGGSAFNFSELGNPLGKVH